MLQASTADARASALVDGVLNGGVGFTSALGAADGEMGDEALQLLISWLAGDRLTNRADEADRRWIAAQRWRAGTDLGVIDRLAAMANLALPSGHPARDIGFARQLLARHLALCQAQGDFGESIRTLAALLDDDLVPPECGEILLELGDALADAVDAPGWEIFSLAAESYCRMRFVDSEAAGRQQEAERWMARTADYADASTDLSVTDLSQLASLASKLHMAGDKKGAADCYRQIVDQVGLEDNAPTQQFALKEGELRLSLGDYPRAVDALSALLPYAETRYLMSVLDDDIVDAERRLVEAVDALSIAQGALGHWGDVPRTLDRVSGLRLRYRAALRDRQETSIIGLERELDAATRSGINEEGVDLPLRARLLEEYRRLREALPPDALESPSVAKVAQVLEPDEVVVILELAGPCTLVVTICATDVAEPTSGLALEDWASDDWMRVFAGEHGDGWVSALIDRNWEGDPVTVLEWLLEKVDVDLARGIRAEMPKEARRLTVIPHGVLTIVPWWALSSFADLQVIVAASLEELVRTRAKRSAPAATTALVVSNPTLDLPVSGGASCSIARQLDESGFAVVVLPGENATESSFLKALATSSVLHFAGHGRVERRRSALELHAGKYAEEDPFPAWMAAVSEWRRSPQDENGLANEQWAQIDGIGTLYQREWEKGLSELFLEYDEGTLAAVYDGGGRLVRISEMWSASDILVGEALTSCRLAVLCACESGAGAGRGDETPGLAAALSLAGVDTVIGSLWRVEEPFAALWVELFYEDFVEALRADQPALNVRSLVSHIGERLRDMELAEARPRLLALADAAKDPWASLELEAYAERLGDPPFAAAWRWAAFYVAGAATVEFSGASS